MLGVIVMDINRLKELMMQKKYDMEYIELCINYATNLRTNNMPIIFDSRHLAMLIGISANELYSYYSLAEKLYSEVIIPKKSGGNRLLNVPSENLKYIQKWILNNIIYNIECHDSATGFIPEKSIVENATPHIGKECVINLDMKDFFPSINYIRIFNLFKHLGYTDHLSMIFSGLCTYESALPQGSPASPYLSNLICSRLDNRFEILANYIGASYTRYADDITFSGKKEITRYIKLMKRVIKDEGFEVNEKKVRVHYQYHKQMVTGLIVNEKLSVPIKTKKYLRQQIYYAQKFGVSSSLEQQGVTKSNYQGHLFGMAYFIKMVEPKAGDTFIEQLNHIDWES